jgi:hypothetical protein
VEALRKKERGGQNRLKLSLPPKMVHSWASPPGRLMHLLAGLFESHPVLGQTQGSGAVFSWLYGIL